MVITEPTLGDGHKYNMLVLHALNSLYVKALHLRRISAPEQTRLETRVILQETLEFRTGTQREYATFGRGNLLHDRLYTRLAWSVEQRLERDYIQDELSGALLGSLSGVDGLADTLSPKAPLKTVARKSYSLTSFANTFYASPDAVTSASVDVIWTSKTVGTIKLMYQD
ncbi:hypothetical protein DXG01_009769 [Tephrocybe rancida]|nr:hypothetical protein DXG01_009769 [Tephrocybe rancida]